MLPRVLETERLRLEATTVDHAGGLWSAIEASLPELTPFMPWASTSSAENTVAFAERMQKRWDEQTDWSFTIFFEGGVAGHISLMGYQALPNLAELGYWMRTDLAGRGLMTEAAKAVVDFGFERIGCHRIELRAAQGNRASIRVAEKLGFVREGTLREADRAPDGRHDMHIFGLLVHERP